MVGSLVSGLCCHLLIVLQIQVLSFFCLYFRWEWFIFHCCAGLLIFGLCFHLVGFLCKICVLDCFGEVFLPSMLLIFQLIGLIFICLNFWDILTIEFLCLGFEDKINWFRDES